MASIIKRRKTVQYTQINNHAVQEGLTDLAAIGLLTHIMSLPEDWDIRKVQLQNHFTRRKTDSAWKVLVQHKYIIGFFCYVGNKKAYFYNVSDVPFTQNDFDEFVLDNKKALEDEGNKVTNFNAIPDSELVVPSSVQNVQYSGDSTKRSTTKEIKPKETDTKKHSLSTVNKPADKMSQITEIANEFYVDFAKGRWNKEDWQKITEKYAREFIEKDRQVPDTKLKAYVYGSLKKITDHHDYKRSEDYAEYVRIMEEIHGDAD